MVFERTLVVGFFDGFHVGHQLFFQELKHCTSGILVAVLGDEWIKPLHLDAPQHVQPQKKRVEQLKHWFENEKSANVTIVVVSSRAILHSVLSDQTLDSYARAEGSNSLRWMTKECLQNDCPCTRLHPSSARPLAPIVINRRVRVSSASVRSHIQEICEAHEKKVIRSKL